MSEPLPPELVEYYHAAQELTARVAVHGPQVIFFFEDGTRRIVEFSVMIPNWEKLPPDRLTTIKEQAMEQMIREARGEKPIKSLVYVNETWLSLAKTQREMDSLMNTYGRISAFPTKFRSDALTAVFFVTDGSRLISITQPFKRRKGALQWGDKMINTKGIQGAMVDAILRGMK